MRSFIPGAIPRCRSRSWFSAAGPKPRWMSSIRASSFPHTSDRGPWSGSGRAEQTGSLETLSAAQKHFREMLRLNSDLEEAKYAQANLKSIDKLLAAR